jgi:hypothetical protein
LSVALRFFSSRATTTPPLLWMQVFFVFSANGNTSRELSRSECFLHSFSEPAPTKCTTMKDEW